MLWDARGVPHSHAPAKVTKPRKREIPGAGKGLTLFPPYPNGVGVGIVPPPRASANPAEPSAPPRGYIRRVFTLADVLCGQKRARAGAASGPHRIGPGAILRYREPEAHRLVTERSYGLWVHYGI